MAPTGHMSGPPDLQGSGEDAWPSPQSICASHLVLGTEPGAMWLCVYVAESECRGCLAWHRVGYGSIQNVSTLGTWEVPI